MGPNGVYREGIIFLGVDLMSIYQAPATNQAILVYLWDF